MQLSEESIKQMAERQIAGVLLPTTQNI